jgi:DNA invertase Pin-like site-specific DNA recombinase
MYVAYYRVSTQRQGQSGLGLEAQRSAVQNFTTGKELIAEFTEVESGRKSDRPQLAQALALAKSKKAILVIAKLDRLARNVHFISGLLESGVQFVAADMPEADRTFLQMAAVFAEWEARKISERTKSALQAARERGTKLGSPNPLLGSKKGAEALVAKGNLFAQKVAPVLNDIVARVGTNLREIAHELELRGVKTAKGCDQWHPATVGKLMRRIKWQTLSTQSSS